MNRPIFFYRFKICLSASGGIIMTFFDRVKGLADDRKISMAELERKINIAENSSYKWKKVTPKGEVVNKIADIFNVSTDYLYGRTENKTPHWALNEKDEKDIAEEVEKIINGLDDGSGAEINFYGEPMSEEQKALFMNSLEMALRMAKEEAKRKYTPKKYRD